MRRLTIRWLLVRMCTGALACAIVPLVGALAADAPADSVGTPGQPVPSVILRAGYENSSYFPWSMPDGRGTDLELLRAVARKNGVMLQLQTLPWDRCLRDLEAGALDAVLNASYSPDRAERFRYPMKGDKPDLARRLHMDGYSLYRRQGVAAEWNAGKLEGYDGVVATQTGFSVIGLLHKAGVKVDDHFSSTEEILREMQAGRVQAAALLSANAEHLLRRNPQLAAGIEKARNDLVFQAYYLIFSREFSRLHPELTEKIWKDLAVERSSPGYGQRIARMYAGDSRPAEPAAAGGATAVSSGQTSCK